MTSAHVLREPIREALKSLKAHKVRAFLTALGMVIGVAGVVTVIQLNKSLEGRVLSDLQSDGLHTFYLTPGMSQAAWKAGVKPRRVPLSDDLVQEVQSLEPALRRVSRESFMGGRNLIRLGAFQRRGLAMVVDEHYFDARKMELAWGRGFTAMDRIHRASVAVLGARIAEDMGLTGPEAIGRTFQFGPETVEVVGILKSKGDIPFAPKDDENADFGEDSRLLVPTGSFKSLMPPWARDSSNYILQMDGRLAASEAEARLRATLRSLRGLKAGDPDNFNLFGNQSMVERIEKVTTALMAASALLVGISMLVGGIGVMNIMLVSVTERTREIGVRKALGARRKLILLQFLVEAGLLCGLGGLVGLLLGQACGTVLARTLMHFMASPPLWSLVAAVLVPVLSGLVFGFYPAYRASRLDPIEALRAE